MPGVVRTRVGYAGGTTANPTYHRLGDHTETLQLEYDPERISYQELLDEFWASHNPAERPWSRQYMAAIFYHDGEQKRLAEASRDRVAATLGQATTTAILPAGEFYRAEDYHQKYSWKADPHLSKTFPLVEDYSLWVVATAAGADLPASIGSKPTGSF